MDTDTQNLSGNITIIPPFITTLEKPFKLYSTGIFFREENGFGIVFTRKCTDINTSLAIESVCNDAFKLGFEEGSKTFKEKYGYI
jgi:hypothetical protein